LKYDPEAIKDLNKLDRFIRSEIFSYMSERIARAASPRNFGKPLRHDKFGLWRYRVRDFRIVCELSGDSASRAGRRRRSSRGRLQVDWATADLRGAAISSELRAN
jgi:mRNA interferase RelE/StbE